MLFLLQCIICFNVALAKLDRAHVADFLNKVIPSRCSKPILSFVRCKMYACKEPAVFLHHLLSNFSRVAFISLAGLHFMFALISLAGLELHLHVVQLHSSLTMHVFCDSWDQCSEVFCSRLALVGC